MNTSKHALYIKLFTTCSCLFDNIRDWFPVHILTLVLDNNKKADGDSPLSMLFNPALGLI